MPVPYRLIGLWLGEDAPGWPDVTRFVRREPAGTRRGEVAERLDAGVPTDRAYMGFSRCRLCDLPNGSGERTDGVFIWPEGLSHYVREHGVRLPEVIETQLLEVTVDPVEVAKAASASDTERDASWWRSIAGSG